jgi:hypothetical protein
MSDNLNRLTEVSSEIMNRSNLSFADVINPTNAAFKIGEAIGGMIHDTAQKHLPDYHIDGASTAGHDAPSTSAHEKAKVALPGEAKDFQTQKAEQAAGHQSFYPPARQASPAHH